MIINTKRRQQAPECSLLPEAAKEKTFAETARPFALLEESSRRLPAVL
jgi:hypothetical protein